MPTPLLAAEDLCSDTRECIHYRRHNAATRAESAGEQQADADTGTKGDERELARMLTTVLHCLTEGLLGLAHDLLGLVRYLGANTTACLFSLFVCTFFRCHIISPS